MKLKLHLHPISEIVCGLSIWLLATTLLGQPADINTKHSEHQPSTQDQEIRVTIEEARCRVPVENRTGQSLELVRVDGPETTVVAECRANTTLTVDAPLGIYCLQSPWDKSRQGRIQIPLPLLADGQVIPLQIDSAGETVAGEPKSLSLVIDERSWTRSAAGFCWVPPGPAVIGDRLGIGQPDERPVRVVELSGFWIGETEVTNAEYAQFLSEQSDVNAEWLDLESRKCRIKPEGDTYITTDPKLPVVTVTYAGAEAYADWLAKKLEVPCRLPTEFEWEKAARGPYSFVYDYGNVYLPPGANQESGRLLPVQQFGRRGFGTWDMTGNAFEWVAGRETPRYAGDSMTHLLRGGSFVLDGMYLRNSFRMRQSPATMTDDFGFRIVCESEHPPAEFRRR